MATTTTMILLRGWLAVWLGTFISFPAAAAWEATWESLDSRPLPSWYSDAKFGIFLHWGVFSVPGFGSEWFWAYWKGQPTNELEQFNSYFGGPADFVKKTEKPGFSYQEYAHRFDATLYRPEEWADVFSKAGAQYVVLTSKHCEGFCNWDSRSIPATWNWNVMDVGPKRDLLGDLAKAVKNVTSHQTKLPLKFGVYHALVEWFNPLYLRDKHANFTTTNYVDSKILPELYDLVERYEPELIWSDAVMAGDENYWKAKEFLAWYANNSTVKDTAVWNDRWSRACLCKHGAFFTCTDRYQPPSLVQHKWESCQKIDQESWGWSRITHYENYMTVEEIIHLLIRTVALNGNLLLNVGPGPDGTLSPFFVGRLLGVGDWLQVNGEAIYKSRPWQVCQNETASAVHYTTQPGTLYALFTQWPKDNVLRLQCPQLTEQTIGRMLGYDGPVLVDSNQDSGISIRLPQLTPDIIPCQHAWVVALTEIGNLERNVAVNHQETSTK